MLNNCNCLDPDNPFKIDNNINLRRIAIENSGVKWLSNETFKPLVKLEYLKLTGNHQMVLGSNMFKGLLILKTLTIIRK